MYTLDYDCIFKQNYCKFENIRHIFIVHVACVLNHILCENRKKNADCKNWKHSLKKKLCFQCEMMVNYLYL